MARRRSLTTLSLAVAIAISAGALLAQPTNASDRFSEAWNSTLARFESPLELMQLWFVLGSRTAVQPQEGATIVPGGKDGATIVPGGKEGAAIVPGGIPLANPTGSRQPATDDRSY